MSNPSMNITVYDMPRCVRSGLVSLNKLRTMAAVEGQIITSEVGPPHEISVPQWREPICIFDLRKARKDKVPDHVFGGCRMGNAFSAFLSREIAVPPVGSTSLLQPRVTPQQKSIIDLYQTVRADALWIFHMACPLGTALTLRIFPPEVDESTETKGIIWRPADHPSIAVFLPHSNDLAQIKVNEPRSGQSGLAIKVKLIEDNTTETVDTPLSLLVMQATMNVFCTGLQPSIPFSNVPALNFNEVVLPNIDLINECSSEEVINSVEISGDTPTEVTNDTETPQVIPNIPIEKTVKMEQPQKRKVANQQGAVASRWFELSRVTVPVADRGWRNVLIDPSNLNISGENISKAYRRNVWVTGCKKKGYSTALNIKFKITRSPKISGIIEIVDSNNSSSSTLVAFGENKNVPIMFSEFSSFLPFNRPRHYNNEWLRTDEAIYEFRWRVLTCNRTSEVNDIQIEIMIAAGEAKFDVPTKPKSTRPINLDLYNRISDLIVPFERINNCSGFESVVPLPALTPYEGNVEDAESFDSEQLVQDEFATEIHNGRIPTDTNILFSLNLSIAPDLSGAGGQSTMAEKFERHIHMIPTREGAFGPEIGEYTVVSRVPATITGHIEHVAVPGDMLDEVAIRAFGLASILSLAGAGIKALGGQNFSGFLNAGVNVMNTVKGIIGNSSSNNHPSESLSGNIPISRFVQFLKPILENENLDPTFGALIVKARDFINYNGENVENIPLSIFAKLLEPAVERNAYSRTVTPVVSISPGVRVPRDRYKYILQTFLSHDKTFIPNSFQNLCFIKFLLAIANEQTGCFDIQQTLDLPITDDQISLMNHQFNQFIDPNIESPTQLILDHEGL